MNLYLSNDFFPGTTCVNGIFTVKLNKVIVLPKIVIIVRN